MSVVFGEKSELTIGRDARNDIKLDGLQISNGTPALCDRAAVFAIEDLRSTNGVYVNGKPVSKQQIGPHDTVQVGAF
jgi:pSer/pThr/pTyr-binding forkhead associated (FHA) protein